MEASTAGVLSFKPISYSRDLVLARIFRTYFPFCRIFLLLIQVFLAFQGYSLLEYGGGPEKDRVVCFCGGTLPMLSPDSSCQQDVLWHDGDSPGMDGTQVSIVKQPDKVRLCRFLETQYRRLLEPQVCLEILGDLPHQPLERQLPDEQC